MSRYAKRAISALQAMKLLDLERRQFFEWDKRYKEQGEAVRIYCGDRNYRLGKLDNIHYGAYIKG